VELAITKELCLAQKTSSATLIIHARRCWEAESLQIAMIGAGYVDVERLTMSFGVKRVARYFRDAGCRVLAGVLPDELVRSLMGKLEWQRGTGDHDAEPSSF
jgi:hypothetical protein